MTEILQANLFFFITSIAVITFTLLLCFAVYQVIKILKSIRRITERIEEGSEMIAGDMENFRTFVTEGSLVTQLIGFFMGKHGATARRRKTRRSSEKKIVITDDE
jgi:hypothetical protein